MDYQKAASYWIEKDKESAQMERNKLLAETEKFIMAHNTCALATGYDGFARCTPIEYTYRDGKFWLLSEGGLKFKALQWNKNVCLAIFDSYSGFDRLGGMQISGTAELVAPWSAEYMDLLEVKKLSAENLKKLPITMYLIKITPAHIDFLWSEFKKMGFSSRQHLSFPELDLSYLPLNEGHADSLLPIWSDEEVIKYTNIKSPCTPEAVRGRINRLKDFDVFAVVQDERVIGVIGCPCISREKSQYGIFYQFRTSAWGKGIATAAAEWLLQYMEQKYPSPTLFADVVVDNVASEKILNRLGFQLASEGTFERNGRKMKVHNYIRH